MGNKKKKRPAQAPGPNPYLQSWPGKLSVLGLSVFFAGLAWGAWQGDIFSPAVLAVVALGSTTSAVSILVQMRQEKKAGQKKA